MNDEDGQKVIVEATLPKPAPSVTGQKPLPPTTTFEENLSTEAKRIINWKWESTQSNVAYLVIMFALFNNTLTVCVGAYALLAGLIPSAIMVAIGTGALMQINSFCGIVLGFYFGRTNHARPDALVGSDLKGLTAGEISRNG